jgi:3-oxoacyl-[acyl-carrier protein] reductase
MFMSVVDSVPGVSVYPELAGGRVLITGISSDAGVDVARAFASHRTYLIMQTADTSPAMTEVAALLTESATNLQLFNEPLDTRDAARRFAQTAAQIHGGIDTVVNLISISPEDISGLSTEADVETFISDKFSAQLELTRVIANRMRTTWTEGSILNAVLMPEPATQREVAVGGLIHAALAAMTRGEAQAWAEHAIRINAIGPRGTAPAGAALSSEPEVASLALYLASKKGRTLSGQMFDAAHICRRS